MPVGINAVSTSEIEAAVAACHVKFTEVSEAKILLRGERGDSLRDLWRTNAAAAYTEADARGTPDFADEGECMLPGVALLVNTLRSFYRGTPCNVWKDKAFRPQFSRPTMRASSSGGGGGE